MADGTDPRVAAEVARLTPQAPAVPPALTADVPGAAVPTLDSKIADQVIRGLPRLRATGLLHDPFEALQLEYEHGAKADIICFFEELCAGKHCPSGGVHSDSALLILDVRAVCFYKDETCTSLRPLGIGECLRRAALCCYTKQRKSTWEFFYTLVSGGVRWCAV